MKLTSVETYRERKKKLRQIANDTYDTLVSKILTYGEFRTVLKYLDDIATARNNDRQIS